MVNPSLMISTRPLFRKSCGLRAEMKFVEPPPSHFPTSSSSSSSAITKEEQPPLEAHGDQKPEQHSFATRVPSETPTSNQEAGVESEVRNRLRRTMSLGKGNYVDLRARV